jgi:transposase
MVRLYARALKGKRARGSRPQKRGKNVSMISAITIKEVLTFFNILGATDRITFVAFIIRKLVPQLWKGACVVLDNCNIHKGKEIEKAIEKAGGQLLYLSPYSPDFPPLKIVGRR